MTHISHTTLRQDLDRYLDEAASQGKPIVVELEGGKANVVLMSEAELTSLYETLHLLSDPLNAQMLLESIRQADAGQLEEHDLIHPE